MTSPLPPGSVPAGPVIAYAHGPVLVPAELVPDRQGMMACLSSNTRKGGWTLSRLFRALAIMGEVKLDLRNVHLGEGTSEIHVRAFMGNVEILIPHNLRVEVDGTPFLAAFEVKRGSNSTPSPDAPLIRITGGAFMANVEVRIIDPDRRSVADQVRAWVKGAVSEL